MERSLWLTSKYRSAWRTGNLFVRHESNTPRRIYTQHEYFQEKFKAMKSNNPDKYALASTLMNFRSDLPPDYEYTGRMIVPSAGEKRMLVLTRIYKSEKDIPERISEKKIADMKERRNLLGASLCICWLTFVVVYTIKWMAFIDPLAKLRY